MKETIPGVADYIDRETLAGLLTTAIAEVQNAQIRVQKLNRKHQRCEFTAGDLDELKLVFCEAMNTTRTAYDFVLDQIHRCGVIDGAVQPMEPEARRKWALGRLGAKAHPVPVETLQKILATVEQ